MKTRAIPISSVVKTLTADEVLSIHEMLTIDMADSDDAISPAGIKNETLLHSAVSRQTTGLGSTLKYATPEENAATLCYGVCSNHAFHNGNKRTALVSMLCHLDKNDRTFTEAVTQSQLYDLMMKIADHKLLDDAAEAHGRSDEEVRVITEWIRRRTRRIDRNERLVTFRELRAILGRFGFEFENLHSNQIDVVKYVEVETQGWFSRKRRTERRRITRIPWPREGEVVARKTLRDIRRQLKLTEDDGVDSTNFHASELPLDYFIKHYRGVLRRLAKT